MLHDKPSTSTLSLQWKKLSLKQITRKNIILVICSLCLIFLFVFPSNTNSFYSSSGSSSSSSSSGTIQPKDTERFFYSDGLFKFTADDNPTKYPFSSEDIEELHSLNLEERLEIFFPYSKDIVMEKKILQNHKFKEWYLLGKDIQSYLRSWKTEANLKEDNYNHILFNDRLMYRYVLKEYALLFPEILEIWNKMPKNIFKYNFFKYLVLLKEGGIYSDIDTNSLKPLREWPTVGKPQIGALIGIEGECDCESWKGVFARRVQLCQWTMQFKRNHPILKRMIIKIIKKFKSAYDRKNPFVLTIQDGTEFDLNKLKPHDYYEAITELTGPGLFTDVVYEYLNSLQDPTIVNPNNAEEIFNNLRFPEPKDTKHSMKLDKFNNENIGWEMLTKIKEPIIIDDDVMILPEKYFNSVAKDNYGGLIHHKHYGSWKLSEV